MAGGLGTRLFVQGDVISAADVNGYLMNQSMMRFPTTAARDTAFGNGIAVGVTVGGVAGDGKPLLQEGMFAYIDFNNDVTFFNGSQWVSAPTFVLGDGEVTTVKIADDAVTGDKIADGAVTSAHIANGTVIAADIAAGTITATELADGAVTSGKILNDTIVNADINTSAAIAYSKLNLATSIVNADINASAAIDKTKISGTAVTLADTGVITSTMIENDSIVNADIKSNAAIAYSKLSLSNSIVNADISSSAAIEQGKIADSTIDTKTSNYTLVLTDKNKFIEMNVGSANTVSVPTDASVNFPIGSQINITQYGSGKTQVVAVTSGTTSIRSTPGQFLRAQYSSATLVKRAANEWYLIGDLSAS
jgi:hypothetical protein